MSPQCPVARTFRAGAPFINIYAHKRVFVDGGGILRVQPLPSAKHAINIRYPTHSLPCEKAKRCVRVCVLWRIWRRGIMTERCGLPQVNVCSPAKIPPCISSGRRMFRSYSTRAAEVGGPYSAPIFDLICKLPISEALSCLAGLIVVGTQE